MLKKLFLKKARNILQSYEVFEYKPAKGCLKATGYALLEFDVVVFGIKIGSFTSIIHQDMDDLRQVSKKWDLQITNQTNIKSHLTTNPAYRFSL